MISPFKVYYLSLPWGSSFCSILVCQHNQRNFRSLASLLNLGWRRICQSTAYVHEQTRVLKVPVLQLLFCGGCGVIRLDCRTGFCLYIRGTRKCHINPVLESHSSKVAMPPVSLLSRRLNEVHWLKTFRATTSNCRTYVDNYTKWKADLFSAHLQKELTHNIWADFAPAADMKSMQSPEWMTRKIFKTTERSVEFMNESFCSSRRNLRS